MQVARPESPPRWTCQQGRRPPVVDLPAAERGPVRQDGADDVRRSCARRWPPSRRQVRVRRSVARYVPGAARGFDPSARSPARAAAAVQGHVKVVDQPWRRSPSRTRFRRQFGRRPPGRRVVGVQALSRFSCGPAYARRCAAAGPGLGGARVPGGAAARQRLAVLDEDHRHRGVAGQPASWPGSRAATPSTRACPAAVSSARTAASTRTTPRARPGRPAGYPRSRSPPARSRRAVVGATVARARRASAISRPAAGLPAVEQVVAAVQVGHRPRCPPRRPPSRAVRSRR